MKRILKRHFSFHQNHVFFAKKIQEPFNIFNIVLFDKFFLQHGTEAVITCLVFTCTMGRVPGI